jgi:hypothetical protein
MKNRIKTTAATSCKIKPLNHIGDTLAYSSCPLRTKAQHQLFHHSGSFVDEDCISVIT